MSVGFIHNNAYEKTAGNGVTMLGLPDWANAEAITSAQLQAGYTVPANGLFVCVFNSMDGGGENRLTCNGVVVGVSYNDNGAHAIFGHTQIPVSAGDVMLLSAGPIRLEDAGDCSFVPFKTA